MDQQDDWSNSSLSSVPSDADEQMDLDTIHTTMKTEAPSQSRQREATPALEVEPDYFSSISSDTSGSLPNSPSATNAQTDEELHEQVTECLWEGCPVGDLGNMDRLVEHLHNKHIEGNRQKEKGYTCEWTECQRKGISHASAYALKSHMRSHTREKPFYCALPECDRSFTRSDALAKHMRTVHETEALRPSDPVPKSMQPTIKNMRLKLIVKNPPNAILTPASPSANAPLSPTAADNQDEMNISNTSLTPFETSLFAPSELAMGPKALFRLLRRQVHWAEEDSEALKRECEVVEAIRKREWLEKELLLDQVMKNELDWHARREAVLRSLESAAFSNGQAQSPAPFEETNSPNPDSVLAAISPPRAFARGVDQTEAAAVLATMHQES